VLIRTDKDVDLTTIRSSLLTAAGLLLLVSGCATTTGGNADAAEPIEAAPELTLNLPDQSTNDCAQPPTRDFTFLDKGYMALAAGDHVEAVQYFGRYQRVESSAAASWEAGIAITYDSMLPRSPSYDPGAARESYQALQGLQPEGEVLHPGALIMQEALSTLIATEAKVNALQADNARLSEELNKREEALKRLRELTLGQPAAAQ
jgi:hypothetical protein